MKLALAFIPLALLALMCQPPVVDAGYLSVFNPYNWLLSRSVDIDAASGRHSNKTASKTTSTTTTRPPLISSRQDFDSSIANETVEVVKENRNITSQVIKDKSHIYLKPVNDTTTSATTTATTTATATTTTTQAPSAETTTSARTASSASLVSQTPPPTATSVTKALQVVLKENSSDASTVEDEKRTTQATFFNTDKPIIIATTTSSATTTSAKLSKIKCSRFKILMNGKMELISRSEVCDRALSGRLLPSTSDHS